jgi:hypothetical protein
MQKEEKQVKTSFFIPISVFLIKYSIGCLKLSSNFHVVNVNKFTEEKAES